MKFCPFWEPGSLSTGLHRPLESSLALPSGQVHKTFPQTICTRSFSSRKPETPINADAWYQMCLECHAHHKIRVIMSSSCAVHKRHTGPDFPTLFHVGLHLLTTSHNHENSYVPMCPWGSQTQ